MRYYSQAFQIVLAHFDGKSTLGPQAPTCLPDTEAGDIPLTGLSV